ncbi:PREDICTED: uncharacterized protein LOC104698956 [Camelina sativa]|uniref:Uncharacterized protein LOC104698956 n=1 Tax=Camelina sativa TaxID=90675 RepID=A0ABM0SKT9_CAMSA|nr:PREDICTED: uncharacterized protein LOC104698956 [Camelina sativa]
MTIERDTYQKTGCLNLECSGFVQVSNQFAVGSAFSPTSSYGGNQFDVTMFIWKDANDGNWWLIIDSSLIGYWPEKLFTHLAHGPAELVLWGGEIVNTHAATASTLPRIWVRATLQRKATARQASSAT